MKASLFKVWILFHRLKITFLLIFISVNYTFLKKYSFDGNLWMLLAAFTVQNFALHIFNNYFDSNEDEISSQRKILSSPLGMLALGISATIFSALLVWYYGFSLVCYFTLFAMMFVYSVPITKKWRVKNVLFLKNITGSLFWWYLPFVLIAAFHTQANFRQIFIENVTTLAIFMPFEPLWDIKDTEGDLASGIKTIPNQFGLAATKLLVVSAFLLLSIIKLSNITFVVFFLVPMIFMTILITPRNKLLISQFIMLFVAVHAFAGHMLLPTILMYYVH